MTPQPITRALVTLASITVLLDCTTSTQNNGGSGQTLQNTPPGFGSSTAPTELPVISAENLRSSNTFLCERGLCVMPVVFETPTTPAITRTCIVEPGATLEVPGSNNFDVMGVVVAGELALRRTPINDMPVTATSWTAFRRADGSLLLANSPSTPPAAVVIVVARTVAQPVSIGPATAPAGTSKTTAQTMYNARLMDLVPNYRRASIAPTMGEPIQLVALSSLDVLSWGGGAFRARLAFEAPISPRASLGVLVGAARAGVAEHVHETSYELLTPVMADGMVRIPSTGDESLGMQSVVRPGDSQVIPAGTRHAWVPAGTVPLIAVQAYAPPGPEQRFRVMSR